MGEGGVIQRAKQAKYGNIVMVPAGFKVVEGSAGEEISVQNGVVIEDSAGNQFVWIPVGIITKNDGSKSDEIKLGRYTFDEEGVPKEEQLAYTNENPTNYTNNYYIITLSRIKCSKRWINTL